MTEEAVLEKPLIQFKKLEKQFGNKRLFRGFDLDIKTGEFVCLLGPSGCGKSTLLRVLSGLEDVSSGDVLIQTRRNEMGFVFQEPRLLPWRTAFENVQLPLELQGQMPTPEALRSLFEKVQLHESAQGLYPKQLSGGMKMRVSLARALSNRPTLLLMDEPLAALDETTRFHLQAEVRRIYELGQPRLTVLFVTHSVSEAAFLSSRVIIMNHNGEKAIDLRNPLPAIRGESLRNEIAFFETVKDISAKFKQLTEAPR